MRLLIVLVAGIALLGHAIPYIVRDQAVLWLKQQGVEDARLEKLRVHWLSGEVELQNLKTSRQSRPPLNLERLFVSLDYSQLLEKRIFIDALAVKGLEGGVQEEDGTLWLGPVNLTKLQKSDDSEPEPADTGPSDWQFGIADVALENLYWRLNTPQLKQELRIDNAAMSSLVQWQANAKTDLNLQGMLNGAAFSLQTAAVPLPQDKSSRIHIKLDAFPLESVAAAWVPALKGSLTTDLEVALNLSADSGTISHTGTITLDAFSWQEKGLALSNQKLEWRGSGSAQLEQMSPSAIRLDGKLASSTSQLQQTGTALSLGGLNWQGKLDMTLDKGAPVAITGPQHIKLSGIKLQQGDMELALKSLKQQGPLDLAMTGGTPARLAVGLNAELGGLDANTPDLAVTSQNLTLVTPLTVNWNQGLLQGISATLEAAITGLNLAMADQQLAVKGESLNLSSPLTLGFDKGELAAVTATPALTLGQLEYQQQQNLLARVQTGNVLLTMKNMAPDQPALSALNLQLSGVNASMEKTGFQLLTLDQLVVKEGYYSPEKAGFAAADLQQLAVAAPSGQKPMTSMQQVALTKLAYVTNGTVGIDRASITGSDTRLTLNKDQSFAEINQLQKNLATLENSAQPTADKTANKDAKPVPVRVGQFVFKGSNQIQITDKSVQPTFKSRMEITKLSVKGIDTGADTPIPFVLDATINKHATLAAKGEINLLGGEKSGHWELDVKNADLPVISPYAVKYVGYYLQSGRLDFTSSGTLKKSVLAGKNHIRLNRLEVKQDQSDAATAFNEKLNMPLGTAIAILQDDKGNIVLDIPVDGSLDDPQFGYQSIINKLAGKGLKKAALGFLTKSLQPYGALITLASTAISASENGSFINLAPVNFAPGKVEISADMQGYLGKIGEMLRSREGLRLNLCGNAVAADKTALLPELQKTNQARKKPLAGEAFEQEVSNQLQALATKRGERVTDSLLAAGIDVGRLFPCFPVPQPNNTELKPGVVLGL